MTRHTLARLELVGAALLFSTGGAAIKSTSLSNWQIAGLRSAIAALAMVCMVPAARHRWSPHVSWVGVLYALNLILYVTANKLTTAANTIFLQSGAPLYILLLSPWLLREKLRRTDFAVMALLAIGLGVFFRGSEPRLVTASNPPLGNALAVAAGICWAGVVMGLRWIGFSQGAKNNATPAVVAGNMITFAVCLPFMFPFRDIHFLDLTILFYLGIVQVGLAYVFLTSAIRHVPALEASILLLVEPALNPVWAWLVKGEIPGFLSILGGVTILGATVAKSWWDDKCRS